MATSAKDSEEQPVRTDAPESESPRQSSIIPVNNRDEENVTEKEDVVQEPESKEAIWEAEKAGEGYYVPIYIWCASIVFPLCAGCFGPMASAFGICALAETWRVENVTKAADGMRVGTDIEDPEW
jgi:potassium channel subfamily K